MFKKPKKSDSEGIMELYNQVGHTWQFRLYGVEWRLDFPEWQCRLAGMLGGAFWLAVGLILVALPPHSGSRTSLPSNAEITIQSIPPLNAYLTFLWWILPYLCIVGAVTLYRRYEGLLNLAIAFGIMAFSISSIERGELAFLEWFMFAVGVIWSLAGLWQWCAGTVSQLRNWWSLVLRRSARSA